MLSLRTGVLIVRMKPRTIQKSVSCGAVHDSGAAFWALIVNHDFLAVTHRLHLHIAVWAEERTVGGLRILHKILTCAQSI